ncbi:MAG: aspartate aminotransferase family protein [Eubacteriaceae bacterium]
MNNNIIDKGKECIMNTYSRFPIAFKEGKGVYLYDNNGKEYVDFVAGIAVNCLGYGNKGFAQAVTNQLNKLNHVSNLYWTEPAIKVAEKLTKYTGLDKVFFCNSGAESVEAALKLSRIYSKKNKGEDCYEIISMKQSFHGRTMGALSLTGQEKYHKNLNPLLSGIIRVNLNDIEDLKNNITENTSAIIIEPIQGEGGINPTYKEYLKQVREICDKENIVLIFDEVQSGIGRTGHLFAFQHYGVIPDIVTSAKGLGNGIPIGAIIAKEKFAKEFTPGTHASTFGGNGVASAAADYVLQELMENGLLEKVKNNGKYLNNKLLEFKEKYNIIEEVRGIGMMQGIQINKPVADIVNACMEKGLLLVGAGVNVIRFVPPLIITKEEIDKGLSILASVLEAN